MNVFFWSRRVAAAVLALAVLPALAGPGAHGPGGEHLDAPAAGLAAGGYPRVDASSDLFELVGQLDVDALSLLIDRFESNAPVLDAKVEVESAGLKALARFRAAQGDYVVEDTQLLAQLRQPGEHALVFTIVQGQDSDLLDGSLSPATATAVADGHDSGIGSGWWFAGAIGAVGALAAAAFGVMRRRRAKGGTPLPQLGEQA